MPTRRDVFRAAGASAAVLATRPLHARVDRVGPLVRDVRARWRRRVDELVSVESAGGEPTSGELRALRDNAQGLLALDAYRDVAGLALEDQCHPDAQALMAEAAEALGRGLTDTADRLEAWLADPDTGSDAGIGLLADQARDLGRQSYTMRLDPDRDRLFQQGVPAADATAEQVRRRARKGLHRLRKLQRVAARIEADPGRAQLRRTPNAETQARLDAGRARWAVTRPTAGVGLTILGILGILVLGLLIIDGLYLAIVGLCAVACGAGSVGVGVMVLGLAVVVGGIVGIVFIIRGLVRSGRD